MSKIFKDAEGNLLIGKEATYIIAHAFHNAGLTSYHADAPEGALAIRREILRLIKSGDGDFDTAADVFGAHAHCFPHAISYTNYAWLNCILCGCYEAKKLHFLDKAYHDSLR